MPEFDLIAPVSDATRRPPSDAELAAVLEALGPTKDLLEAGVGTGRFAVPLGERGLKVTGIDISLEMMRRAREKGVERLIRADLHHLPFPDRSFEGSLIIHVLQLIPEPLPALAELGRVSRQRVVAVFPDHGRWGREGERSGFRQLYREIAKEKGIVLPERRRYWENANKLLEAVPPDHLSQVSETLPRDVDREKAWADMRAFGGLISVPEEVHKEIVAEIRKRRGDRPPSEAWRTRNLKVAWWDAATLPARVAAAPPLAPTSANGPGASI